MEACLAWNFFTIISRKKRGIINGIEIKKNLNRYNSEDSDPMLMDVKTVTGTEPWPLKRFFIYLDTTSGSRDIVVQRKA